MPNPQNRRTPGRTHDQTHLKARGGPHGLSYRDAGVDLAAAASIKEVIKRLAATTHTGAVAGAAGFFAGAIEFPPGGDTLLVASTDSVGTKVKIAAALGRFRNLGIDVVNQNVNDILSAGGEPLFFLDYIGLGKMDGKAIAEIVEGVAQACREAGCALIGGETAELPGMYTPGEFDLVGFVVGSVRKDRILTGASAKAGDVLLGLPSSGPHTNGFSLIRMVFRTDEGTERVEERPADLDGLSIADALLAPHRSYLRKLRPVLTRVRGLAHITGGGVFKNLPRSLPDGLAARIDRQTWEVPPLFRIIQRHGDIVDHEMFRVFNMGVGMIVIVERDKADAVRRELSDAWVIGEVVPRSGETRVTIA